MDENGTPLLNPPPSGRGLGGGAQTPMQLVTPKVVRMAVMEDPLPSSPFMGRS